MGTYRAWMLLGPARLGGRGVRLGWVGLGCAALFLVGKTWVSVCVCVFALRLVLLCLIDWGMMEFMRKLSDFGGSLRFR
ncbi:hypothetical protein JOL62DRAFT_569784 [Phyllosticta paracitricarpa]|uniref:Uncharacterized protein n=1 Tax=Phyllosticta paracitricarpa TaxID=2016321 RepID=A0ABR1NFG5_9PEZI